MKNVLRSRGSVVLACLVLVWLTTATAFGQQSALSAPVTGNGAIPNAISFAGVLRDSGGRILTSVTGVTFLLYKSEEGGAPLWLETQNITPDKTGHYSVQLGAASPRGLAPDLFATGEARWLAVQVGNQPEQARVLLVAVPYAMKAGDAETVGGLPASAFVRATTSVASAGDEVASPAATVSASPAALPSTSSNVTTTGGTVNAIPLFSAATNIQNSILTQGSGAINVAGKLNLPASGVATATAGFKSRPETLVASSFNSGTSTAVPQTFQLQAEPAGNNTANASGTVNLLYGSGTATPAETGFKINSKGVVTFAAAQTFPGTGTITGVTTVAGSGLIGGGTSGALSLSLLNTCATNQILRWSGSAWACGSTTAGTISGVTAGTDLTGGGTSGKITLNLDTTKVPELAANNTFSGAQTISTANGLTALSVTATSNNNGISGTAYWPSGYGIVGFNFATSGSGGAIVGQTLTPSGVGVTGRGAIGIQGQGTNPGGEAGNFIGYTATSGSTNSGTTGVVAQGGNGDLSGVLYSDGGTGVSALGGQGFSDFFGGDGFGGYFQGGSGSDGGDGLWAVAGSGEAGFFDGNLQYTGTLIGPAVVSRVDHPLDPANKYLSHAPVESSEMKNMYDGVVTTDAMGAATVRLPEWFEMMNGDFRYQLTVMGQFAQAIVAREIENHEFVIRTSIPNVKVSWQVTGVRHDVFAKAHPLQVEEEKDAGLRGFYLHPELYGAPEEKQIQWARHPDIMKRAKAMRQTQVAKAEAARAKARATGK